MRNKRIEAMPRTCLDCMHAKEADDGLAWCELYFTHTQPADAKECFFYELAGVD